MANPTDTKKRGQQALRIGRFSLPNGIYHVTTATRNRDRLFSSFRLGRIVVDALRHQDASHMTETLAFVVMPDHLHWLLQLGGLAELSSIICSVKSSSSRHIRRGTGRRKPVWQIGFHDHALRHEEDVEDVARYIVANPLRAGLVRRIGDYPLWDAKWL